MFNQMGMLTELIRNAGKLRETAEKAFSSLGELVVEGEAGGGLVRAKVNGRLEVVSIQLEPRLLADQDKELIEDLLVAAIAQAQTKAREAAAQSLSSLGGAFPAGLMPGLAPFSGPGGPGAP